MDLKLRFRRPRRKVSRNARAAYQEPSPGQSENQFICPVCGNLDAHHFEPAEGDERLFADAPSLNVHAVELRNASAHCLACRAIIGLLEENLGHFDDEELVVIKAYEKKLVFEMHQPGDLPGGRFELYRHSDSQIEGASSMELWPAVGTARTLVPSFSISDAYPLIASWMDECKSNHAECAGDSNSPLPTRLLAVGAENEIAPYLHETQPNEVGQYIALSHCWGPPEHRPPRTTRGNLGLRRLSIPIEELPPTFSEALQLSRALGIPYLWIDSLCIIQDDAADWEREAARMQEVYRNAVLTISADGAVDSRVGLFKPVSERKLPRSIATCCPAAEVEGATAESESLWGRMTDLNVNMDGMFGVHTAGSSSRDGEPLSRRGWTFQEWVLSRRIVHFTTGELLWDCLETEGCECQTHFKSRASRSGIRRRGLTDDLEYWGMRDEASHWGMMVSNSTARDLTYDSDKLPALSGVAKSSAAERGSNDCYLAGLWKSELPFSLLWMRAGVGGIESNISYRRITGYHAPSWSWASIVGPVRCPNVNRGRTLCEILHVSCELAGSNPYGPLSSGLLVVGGLVAKIPDCIDIQNGDLRPGTKRQLPSIYTVYFKDIPLQPGLLAESSEDVEFLAVRSSWDARAHSLRWEGLALQATGDSQDRFARVGVLFLGLEAHTRIARLWRKTRSETSHKLLRAAIGAEMRTITIV